MLCCFGTTYSFGRKEAAKVAACITWDFVYYLFFNKQVGASTTHKLPYGSTRTALTVAHSFPELIWNLADFLTNWFNLIKKFSSRIVFFLKRTKWHFAPLIPCRRPKNVHFFFFFHLEWLKSINVIWSGWNQNPEAVLTNVAFFHMKWLFAPKFPFRQPKNVHFNALEVDQHSTKLWPALDNKTFLKAKSIFLWETIFSCRTSC